MFPLTQPVIFLSVKHSAMFPVTQPVLSLFGEWTSPSSSDVYTSVAYEKYLGCFCLSDEEQQFHHEKGRHGCHGKHGWHGHKGDKQGGNSSSSESEDLDTVEKVRQHAMGSQTDGRHKTDVRYRQ